MRSISVFVATVAAAGAVAVADAPAWAQGKGKDKEPKEQREQGKAGDRDQKPKKAKKAKHQNGKQLVGDKVKKDGKHKFHERGKHAAFVDVKGGKIAGVSVKHAEKGDVPVKKYKTNKKPTTASAPTGGIQAVAFMPVQQTYLGEIWIGFAYIDEWGDEVIYWFPYDMVYDPYTDAVEYIPAY